MLHLTMLTVTLDCSLYFRMAGLLVNWKGCERKRSWLNWGGKLRNFARSDSGNSRKTVVGGTWFLDGDLNKGCPVVVLTILP